MKISIINGSPKLKKSTSELMIEYLMPFISENRVFVHHINSADWDTIRFAEIGSCDILIFAFPLYIDSIPSHMLRFLIELEKQKHLFSKNMVYCIINNGFFEGRQNHIALDQMKNWCNTMGLTWGQGIGIGAGEMLPFLKDIPLGHGPNKNVGRAFKELTCNITALDSGNDLFISPNWPRFLWKVQAYFNYFYPQAKKNGLKKKDLFERVDDENFNS